MNSFPLQIGTQKLKVLETDSGLFAKCPCQTGTHDIEPRLRIRVQEGKAPRVYCRVCSRASMLSVLGLTNRKK